MCIHLMLLLVRKDEENVKVPFLAQHISIESRNSVGQTKHTGAIFFLFYMRLVDMATAYETLNIFKKEENQDSEINRQENTIQLSEFEI